MTLCDQIIFIPPPFTPLPSPELLLIDFLNLLCFYWPSVVDENPLIYSFVEFVCSVFCVVLSPV